MNEPGWKVGVPSAEFTMPPAPIAGRVSVPVGVSETTLSPDSVIMYAVVPAAFTAIMRGLVLNRVVPKTLTTGFSGTTPASVSEPVFRLTISSRSEERRIGSEWSSDVCSSDLHHARIGIEPRGPENIDHRILRHHPGQCVRARLQVDNLQRGARSEERRVGKEC